MVDGHTGKTVFARNADATRYPASLTKVMTLYLLFEDIRAGRVSLNTKLFVSARAAARPASKLGLKRGSSIRVEHAILALVTKSANDVATVVAEALGGSETKFAQRMTRTAKRLGMTRTRFANASGLPNSAQVTTARDMARLAVRIQRRFPKLYKYFKTRTFTYRRRVYRSHNGLLKRYYGTDGIKTGYTRASGFNLISSVRRGRKHVIGVVMGGRSARKRDARMMALVSHAFRRVSNYKPKRMRKIARARGIKPIPLPIPAPRRKAQAKPAPAVLGAPKDLPRVVNKPRPPQTGPVVVDMPRDGRVVAQGSNPGRVFASATPIELKDLPEMRQAVIKQSTAKLNHTVAIKPAPKSSRLPQSPLRPTVLPAGNGSVKNRPAKPGRRGWLIQIGAFDRKHDAKNVLTLARRKARHELKGKPGFTVAFTAKSRRYYRARFSGFTRLTALSACRTLKYRNIGCYPLAP
jgi:D-alanyl-D-alanine carboxypeptidase